VILGDEPPDPATGQLSGDALRISRATRVKKPERRLRAVMDIAKSKSVCWSCSTPQPTFKKDGLMIRAEFKEVPPPPPTAHRPPPTARSGRGRPLSSLAHHRSVTPHITQLPITAAGDG